MNIICLVSFRATVVAIGLFISINTVNACTILQQNLL